MLVDLNQNQAIRHDRLLMLRMTNRAMALAHEAIELGIATQHTYQALTHLRRRQRQLETSLRRGPTA